VAMCYRHISPIAPSKVKRRGFYVIF
jgi:hypothetical protein